MLTQNKTFKIISAVVMICFSSFQATCLLPGEALANAGSDLKKIEYKYYFRGNYTKAIAELREFIKRKNLEDGQIREAREYLAASLIMTGSSAEGKSEFLKLFKKDSSYKGPDPGVFKPIIITTFEQARSEYKSAVIRTVPDPGPASAATSTADPVTTENKPVYKKWWFYATMGAVLLVVAGAASGGGDDPPPSDRGTVTIGINIP